MPGGAPIIIEKRLEVDEYARLSVLRPKQMTAPHLDLGANLGCRRNVSTHEHPSLSVCSEEQRAVRALGGCPGLIVLSI